MILLKKMELSLILLMTPVDPDDTMFFYFIKGMVYEKITSRKIVLTTIG